MRALDAREVSTVSGSMATAVKGLGVYCCALTLNRQASSAERTLLRCSLHQMAGPLPELTSAERESILRFPLLLVTLAGED